jgi:hypothetical protein
MVELSSEMGTAQRTFRMLINEKDQCRMRSSSWAKMTMPTSEAGKGWTPADYRAYHFVGLCKYNRNHNAEQSVGRGSEKTKAGIHVGVSPVHLGGSHDMHQRINDREFPTIKKKQRWESTRW